MCKDKYGVSTLCTPHTCLCTPPTTVDTVSVDMGGVVLDTVSTVVGGVQRQVWGVDTMCGGKTLIPTQYLLTIILLPYFNPYMFYVPGLVYPQRLYRMLCTGQMPQYSFYTGLIPGRQAPIPGRQDLEQGVYTGIIPGRLACREAGPSFLYKALQFSIVQFRSSR